MMQIFSLSSRGDVRRRHTSPLSFQDKIYFSIPPMSYRHFRRWGHPSILASPNNFPITGKKIIANNRTIEKNISKLLT